MGLLNTQTLLALGEKTQTPPEDSGPTPPEDFRAERVAFGYYIYCSFLVVIGGSQLRTQRSQRCPAWSHSLNTPRSTPRPVLGTCPVLVGMAGLTEKKNALAAMAATPAPVPDSALVPVEVETANRSAGRKSCERCLSVCLDAKSLSLHVLRLPLMRTSSLHACSDS